jgi:N12 class adenine-specific DNA methylase
MPYSYDPYRKAELDQRAAEEDLEAQRRLNAQQAKQAAKASEAMAKEDRKAALSQQELDMRAQGMIPVTTADGNLHPDPLWEQKQAEKAAKAAQEQQAAILADQFAREGRKSFVSKVTGLPTALESDEQLAAQKQARADAARKAALNERITALETATSDPAKKRLPTSARDKLAKQRDTSRQEALYGLQSTLQEQAKAVSGGDDYIPFNEAPTPEATAAQERLTRLSQPGADLTEEDIALLEANDATKPQAQKLRNIQALLAKDDEAAKFHDTQAASLFDLKLRRDDPAAWAAKVKERRAAMTPEQLQADLESSSADFQARSQELQAKAAPIQQRRALSQQKLDTLSQQAAQRRQRNLMASEIVTFTRPDGSTEDWPADLAATYEREIAMAQQAESQEAATLEQLQALQDDLQAEAALHAEGATLHQQSNLNLQQAAKQQFSNRLRYTPGMEQAAAEIEALQSDAETRKAVLDDMYPDGTPPEALDALNADVQAKAEQIIATKEGRFQSAVSAYGDIQSQLKENPDLNATAGDLFIAARKKLAQDAGITEAEAKRLLDDAGQLDWDQVTADEINKGLVAESWKSGKNMSQADDARQTRLLSNGAIIVHPRITDEKGYTAAVAASGATPDAQAEALARYPAIRAQQAKQTLETIQEVQSVLTGGLIDGENWDAWRKKKPADVDEAEWALRWTEHNKAQNTGLLGTLISKANQFTRSLYQSGNDLRSQAGGILAGITGSETLMQDAQWASRKAQAHEHAKTLGGNTSDNFLTKGLFDVFPRFASSLIPSKFGSSVAQTGIRLFAGTKYGARFLPSLAAAIAKAETPAQAVKAVSTLTRAGIGGAAIAGAGQTYGAQLADIYGTLRKENPELDHVTALRQAQMPAIASGLATALLTVGFGSTGISRLITRPAEAKAAAAKVFTSQLQRMGFAAEAFVSGGIMETIEESLDEGISQVAAAIGKGHPVQQAVGDFLRTLPEMAVATMIMGGAGEGISSFKESTVNGKQPSTTVNPANLPETIATAESAIDALQIPNADEATLARTQDAARGVLYIAQGSPLTDLDADTLAALDIVADPKKPGSFINGRIVPNAKTGVPEVQEYKAGMAPVNNADGTTGTRPVRVKLIDGQPVISQPTLDKLEKLLPAVRAAVPQDEKSRIQKIAQPSGTPAGQAPAANPVANANGSAVQAPASTGTQPTRSGQPPAQSGTPLAAAASSPAAQQRSAELAILLESRGLTAPQAQLAAQKVIEAQGVVGTSAEEQYTAGIDTEMQALGWIRGTGKNYAFVPPEGSALNAKAPEAQPSTPAPTEDSSAPAENSTDPFAPAASSSVQNPTSSNESDIANRLVVAKARAMKSVPVAARKRFLKFITPLSNHLARFQNAFPGGIVFTDGKAKDDLNYTGAGIAVANSTTSPRLEVNLAELFKSADHLDERDLGSFTRRAVMHEVRHLAALKVITPGQARALWKDLTPALQARVYASYHAVDIHIAINEAEGRVISSDPKKDTSRKITEKEALLVASYLSSPSVDMTKAVITKFRDLPRLTDHQLKAISVLHAGDSFHMAHEFLRMLDEDAEFAGQTSEAMDANPSLGQAILDFLRGVLDEIKRLIATDLDQSTRVQLREFQKLVEGARKKLLSDNPADRLGSTQQPAAPLTTAADNRAGVTDKTDKTPARTDFKPVLGSAGTAYTDSNAAIEYQWAVVDVNSLNVSNDDSGRINPAYPQELQPRDRTSAASEAQVNDIANNFNLDRLAASSSVGDGAPIIGQDGVVESGNGRVMGARRAHTTGKASASTYRATLIARAAEFGLNAEQVEAVSNPVLVRVRTTEVNRVAFVLSANVSTIAPKREMEQAKIDSKQIVPDLFDSFVPSEDGEIFTAANADFIRAFVSQVVPPAERGQVIEADGNLSQSGLRRIRNALFVNAYGTSPEALAALGRLTESINATDVNLARALVAMAPRFAEQNARIANGILYPLSITENLAQALQKLSDLRNRGQSIESWLQEDRIPGIGDDPGPITTALVQYLHQNRQRPRQIIDALDRYAKALDGAGEPRQMSIFGDEKPTQETLWKLAANYKADPALAMGRKNVWHSGSIQGPYDPQKADMDAAYGPGFYSSTSKKRSEGYGKQPARPFTISARKWFDHDAPISRTEAQRIAALLEAPDALDSLFKDEEESGTPIIGEDVWNALKEATSPLMANEALAAAGYDGATYTGNQGKERDYIVWSPSQIQDGQTLAKGTTSPTPGWTVVMPDEYNIVGYTPRSNNRFEFQPIYSNGKTRISEEEALAQGIAKERLPYAGYALAYVERTPSPPLPPKTALKLYRTLTAKAQETGTLTPPQSKALERAESSLGQLFMFDTPNKTLKPAEDLVLERQTASRATFADSTPEQLKLFMATKKVLYSKAAKEKHLRPITRMLVKLRASVQDALIRVVQETVIPQIPPRLRALMDQASADYNAWLKPRMADLKPQWDAYKARYTPAIVGAYNDKLESIAGDLGVMPMTRVPLKGDRGMEKAILDAEDETTRQGRDIAPDVTVVNDVLRASLVAADDEGVARIVAALRSRFKIVKFKDRFTKPVGGYHDWNFIVEVAPGLNAEVQVHRVDYLFSKEIGPGHLMYEDWRRLNQLVKLNPAPELAQLHRRLSKAMEGYYTAIAQAFNISRKTDSSISTPSLSSRPPSAMGLSSPARVAIIGTGGEPSMSQVAGSPSTSKNFVVGENVSGIFTPEDTTETPNKQAVRITTANISAHAGNVDVTPLQGKQADWKKAFTFPAGARMVPLSKLVSPKNELESPRFKAGLKADPRQTAANFITRAIAGEPGIKQRAPLDVSANPDGTFTIHDGNATAQALMLAGWKAVPVNVIEAPALAGDPVAGSGNFLAMGRKSVTDSGPDLFGFNAGLGLDTLLTPRQKEAKLQQSQQLDLFGSLTDEKPRTPSPRPARAPRPASLPQASQQSAGLGELFAPGMAGTGPGSRNLLGDPPGLTGGLGGSGNPAPGGSSTGNPGADTPAGSRPSQSPDSGMPSMPRISQPAPVLDRPSVGSPDRNFEVPAEVENLAPLTDKAKIIANLDAIRLLKHLETERRNATPEEKKKLAAYTGWGAFKEAFNSKYEADISSYWDGRDQRYMPDWLQSWQRNHRPLHKLLRENMSEDEFASASASTLNAHYTAAPFIRSMWKMVKRLGFKGGRAMEPSAGAGHYVGLTPSDLADKTQWQTVELDDLSARLLSKLYPEAVVNESQPDETRAVSGLGFERARIPNGSVDLIISNVPFHESGPRKKGFPNLNLHNFFFAHALDKVKPGGLVAFITSESTMQNNMKQRDFIASKGDLVAAFRLPNNAFKGNAGTEVTTDILILRKPDGTPFQGQAWRNLVEVGRQTITLVQGKDQTVDELRGEAARTGTVVGKEYFKNGKKAIDVSAPIMVNEYFVNHPQHALGTHTLASTMYRAGGYALVAPDGLDVPAALDALVPSLPMDVMGSQQTAPKERRLADREDKPFSFKEQDGKLYEVQADGSMEEAEWGTNPVLVKTWRSWKRLSETIEQLVTAESSDSFTDEGLAQLRRSLNIVYDSHVLAHKPVSRRFSNAHRHLYSDPGYPLTAALENEVITVDPKTGKKTYSYKKADIFTKRIGRPIVIPKTAKNVDDALELSLAWKGHIDPAYASSLLGITPEAFTQQALERPDIFTNPETGLLETSEDYLTGNVRLKLAAAEEAAQDDPKFQRNVEALRTAQPERKEIARISPVLGARWIPAEVYRAFIKDVLQGNDAVEYIPAGNSWIISGSGLYKTEEHGTERKGPASLFKHALDMTEPTVYDGKGEDRTFNPTETAAAKTALDKMRRAFIDYVKTSDTQVSPDPASGIENPAPRIPVWEAVENAFNETQNSHVTPRHVGQYLQFPGLNTDYVYTRAHRRAVIARFLSTRRGMMAHGVGSGKTFNQIILAQEMRRLGLAKKPVIVVQNSTLTQFAKSYLKAYPSAKILVPTKRDFEAQNRKKLVAKIATGNWDAVILPHSQFDLISNKPEAVKAYMDSQIDELMAIVGKTKDKSKVRDLEGMLKRLRDRRQDMLDKLAARQDTAVMWEDLGIDALIMDEAHNYKSLPIITRMGRVKGVPASSNSQRAINFMLKCRDVQSKTGGKNIFLATGTPIKNSMAEAYIMMQFMAPDVLQEFSINNFDDFATTYGQTVTEAEMAWTGAPTMTTRFAKFQNGGALVTMIRSMFDVAFGNEALGLDVPKIKGGEPEMLIVPATPHIQQFNAWTRSVDYAWKNADAKEKEEYTAVPIQTMAAGIAAAVDPRLISPGLADDPQSKVNTALRRVLDIYQGGTAKRTTQIIFSDLRNPFRMDYLLSFMTAAKAKADGANAEGDPIPSAHPFPNAGEGDFDLYKDFKAKLLAAGVPDKEIHLMQSGMTDVQKAALFEKVDNGEIRIIIGSTELLGVGVNIQARLKAVHHLMPPRDFTPAMMEQRNGRIIRQGNLHAAKVEGQPAWNEEVEVINYGTEGSMDSAIYGTLARKQRFITQLLMAEDVQDTFDDPTDPVAVNMAEMAARTLGDPDFIRRIELEKEIKDLRLQNDAFTNELAGKRSRLARLDATVAIRPKLIEELQASADRLATVWTRTAPRPEGLKEDTDISDKAVYQFGGPPSTFGLQTIDTAAKDGAITDKLDLFLLDVSKVAERRGQTRMPVGLTINGRPFTVDVQWTLPGALTPGEIQDTAGTRIADFKGAASLIQNLRRAPAAMAANVERLRQDTEAARQQAEALREKLATVGTFPDAPRLAELEAESRAVEERLRAKSSSPPPPASSLQDQASSLPEAPKRYRYEMRARPPGINTHPTEGLIAHTEGGNRHGYLDYNRRLTDEEVYNFELRPEEAEEPENRPERLAKGRTSVEPATNATILAMARKNPGLIESSMDDAADDTVRDAYEARHLADAEALDYRMPESMRQYSNAPTAQLRTLGLLFRAIAKQPGAFLLGPLTPAQQSAKTLDESLRAYNVPFLYTEEMSGRPATVIYLEPPADVPEEYQVPRYSFEIQAEKQPGTYSINSLMGAGKHATPLYQAIYTWAHNNGFQIVPDSGYTDAGAFRRISHMLSSALRHGTTKHFTPHTKQVPALAGLSGTPEAFAEDIGLLSAIEADLTIAKAPFLSDIWRDYDLDRALHDSSSAATGRITAGLQATKVRLNQENRDAPLHVGAATAKRAFLAHHRLLSDTLRGDTGRQLSGVAGRQSEERRERESLLTNKVLYKGTTTVSQSSSPLAKLGWNHLDRAASAKLAAHTRWLTTPTHALVNRTAHNLAGNLVAMWTGSKDPQPFLTAAHALKREFFPDSVMPREVLAKKREMEIKTSMGSQRAMDLVRALAGNPKFSDLVYPKEFAENPMHRRNLYEAMTGERPMSSLPPELQTLATKLRAMLVDLGKEAVKQGRMSTDTFDNLRGTYMPHYYKEDVQKEKSLFHKFRLGVRDILAQRTTAWHITDTATKDANGEARLVSHSGNQWRFRNQEHMNAFFEDFITQQSLTELQSRYGKKFKNLTAADLMTPSKLDPEVRGRLQEIKRNLHQRYQRNRPLTVAEKEKAGLIMDPVYAIARYAAQMTHDNSTAEWFNFVAADPKNISDIATPGYTEIPDNPRFGRLAGKFVQDDIANQVLEMIEAPNIALQIYDTTLGWWKAGKTVLNPGTHVRNVLGNLFFSQLAGNSVWNPGNVPFYRQALTALRQGGPVLAEAYDAGVLGADFVSAELRQTLRQLLPDPATIVDDGKAPSLLMGIGKAIGKYVGNPANAGFNKITALYQAEDEIFKLAAFLKAKEMLTEGGAGTPARSAAAAAHIRKWFPYFDSGTSGTLKLIGRTAMPFLGFYRESIRIFGHALKERPLALAAGLSVPSIVTMLSAMALGLDDDDLDEIKKDMRGRAGKLLGPTPLGDRPLFSMLLPFRSDTGQIQQFDISAVHPFVDFLGNRVEGGQKDGWWPQMFRSFVAAGPLGNLIYSNMTGEDAFFGSTIVEPNMTTGEAFAARASNAAKTLLPPLVPGGTGFNTLLNMGQRGTSKTLEVRSPAQAMLRTVGGLDVRNATPDLYRLADDWRKANGYEVQEGMDYGSTTPASRARKALFAVLAQDEPNPTALKNILNALDKMGHPVRTEQDVNRLLFYRDPAKLIGGNKAKGITATDAQAQFRASLQGEARDAFEASLQEYRRIKQRAPLLVRQAASL